MSIAKSGCEAQLKSMFSCMLDLSKGKLGLLFYEIASYRHKCKKLMAIKEWHLKGTNRRSITRCIKAAMRSIGNVNRVMSRGVLLR